MKTMQFDWVPLEANRGDYEREGDGIFPYMWFCGEGMHKALPETKKATTIWVKVFRHPPKWYSGVIVKFNENGWTRWKYGQHFLSFTVSDAIMNTFRNGTDKLYFQLWHNGG